MAKEITKTQANKAASVVKKYAIQESKKGIKKGAKATVKGTKTIAKKGFKGLKKLFS